MTHTVNEDFMRNENNTMAVKVNLSLDAVGVCCAIGIGNFEILK